MHVGGYKCMQSFVAWQRDLPVLTRLTLSLTRNFLKSTVSRNRTTVSISSGENCTEYLPKIFSNLIKTLNVSLYNTYTSLYST